MTNAVLFFLLPLSAMSQDFTLPSGKTREEVTLTPDMKIRTKEIGILVTLDSLHSLEIAVAEERCWTREQWDFYVKAWQNYDCKCDAKLEVVIDSGDVRKIYKFEEVKHKFICP